MSVFGLYSRYYNLLYQDKNYTGEAAYVNSLIGKYLPGSSNILDLGCGTGKHDLLLAEIGYQVTGVDMSEEMLVVANSKLAAITTRPSSLNNLAPSPSLNFVHGDIRSVRLGSSFDVVISLFHVMSYQTGNQDLADVFATVRAHLKLGGIFIFDCWYGPGVLTDRPVVRVKRLEDGACLLTRIVEPTMYPNDNLVELNYQILAQDKESGTFEEVRETHRMRYLFYPEVESFVNEAGMSIEAAAEWMTGRAPAFDTWGVCFVVRG